MKGSHLPGVGLGGDGPAIRVLSVKSPRQRVVGDVLADAQEGIIVTDDVLVVVALPEATNGWPNRALGREFCESVRREHLEPVNHI